MADDELWTDYWAAEAAGVVSEEEAHREQLERVNSTPSSGLMRIVFLAWLSVALVVLVSLKMSGLL